MTTSETPSTRRTTLLIGLGVVAVAAGIAVGIAVGGGDSSPDAATNVPPSTTEPAPATTTTSLGPTTTSTLPTSTTTESAPSTTRPAGAEGDLIIPASEDTVIDSNAPDQVEGDAFELHAETNGPDVTRTLLRFDVEGIPDDAMVVRANLRLLVVDEGGVPVLSGVEGAWDEATATWSNAPPVGEPIVEVPVGPQNEFVRIEVTDLVRANGQVDFYIVNDDDDDFGVAARESGDGPILELVLAPAGAVIVGAGDIAGCETDGDEATAAILDQVLAESPDAVVVTLGDNAYESGTSEEFENCYGPTWGRHKSATYPAAGAREYRTVNAADYYEYFAEAAGNPGEGYYSYDHGGWHVVVLNSNCVAVGGCDLGSPQATWLQQDLAASGAACTLAYWHHPVFGSTAGSSNTSTVPFWEILFEAGAEIVLNGDHHFYERFAPQNPQGQLEAEGLIQFTIGTGGHSLSEIGPPAANSEVQFNDAFGVLRLNLTSDSYTWAFLPQEGADFMDTGSGTCH